ncbi:hypothetical protein LFM09_37085 [Lentzea alba]|uniref:hypothetical protein n=1 Tax=Lentzea alba TaxID=2714351 RepID=UPI0039BF094C
MDAGGFGKLVGHSVAATSDLDERRAWRSVRLVLSPAGEIADFAVFGGSLNDLLSSRGQVRASDVSPGGEDVDMENPVDIAHRIPRLWALFEKAA